MSEVERGAGGQQRFGKIPKFDQFLVLKPPLNVILAERHNKTYQIIQILFKQTNNKSNFGYFFEDEMIAFQISSWNE